MFDVYEFQRSIYIVRELCQGNVVFSGDFTSFSEEKVARIVRQILAAIRYMHDQDLIHGNLRCEHIIFEDESDDSYVKLVEFGMAKYENEIMGEKSGDSNAQSIDDNPSAAPELATGGYSDRSDLWSIGVMAYRLLSGNFPFETISDQHLEVNFDDVVWSNKSEDAKDFIRNLLQVDVEKRYSAKDAQRHKWMRTQVKIPKALVREAIKHWRTQHMKTPRLKRAALRVMAYIYTAPIVKDIRLIFEFFDKDHNGVINFKEFDRKIGQAINMSTTKSRAVFDKIDVIGNGTITYCEFLGATLEFRGKLDEDEIGEAFKKIDKALNTNGYITVRDLMFNCKIPQSVAEEMIQEIDIDGNGIGEFVVLTTFGCAISSQTNNSDVTKSPLMNSWRCFKKYLKTTRSRENMIKRRRKRRKPPKRQKKRKRDRDDGGCFNYSILSYRFILQCCALMSGVFFSLYGSGLETKAGIQVFLEKSL